MKIRDRRLIAAAGWLGTQAIRLLSASLAFDQRSLGLTPVDPLQPPEREPFIYALWHEYFLVPITRFGNDGVSALVSNHADGRILGSLIRSTGMRVIHGSTGRGGVAAVRELLRTGTGHVAVTPDGPRGPRREVQPGVIYLASRTGLRIVPIGVGYHEPWRMNSWDRFAVPKPFSRVRCLFGLPIQVPTGLRSSDFLPHMRRLAYALESLTSAAQDWAETGQLVIRPATGAATTASQAMLTLTKGS